MTEQEAGFARASQQRTEYHRLLEDRIRALEQRFSDSEKRVGGALERIDEKLEVMRDRLGSHVADDTPGMESRIRDLGSHALQQDRDIARNAKDISDLATLLHKISDEFVGFRIDRRKEFVKLIASMWVGVLTVIALIGGHILVITGQLLPPGM